MAANWEARFWAKVDRTDDCWEWTAAISRNGYGQFKLAGAKVGAHRVAYELLIGEVPAGYDLDHVCRNRACVNPDHLEPVTRRENVRRGARGRMVTACPSGHAYDAHNTYVDPLGLRHCRACRRDRARESWRSKRSAT